MEAALSARVRTKPDLTAPLLRSQDVAAMLGVTPRHVRRLGAAGEIPKVKLGPRSTRYRLADVTAFIESCMNNEGTPPQGPFAKEGDSTAHATT